MSSEARAASDRRPELLRELGQALVALGKAEFLLSVMPGPVGPTLARLLSASQRTIVRVVAVLEQGGDVLARCANCGCPEESHLPDARCERFEP